MSRDSVHQKPRPENSQLPFEREIELSLASDGDGNYALVAECRDERTELIFFNGQAIGFSAERMQKLFANPSVREGLANDHLVRCKSCNWATFLAAKKTVRR